MVQGPEDLPPLGVLEIEKPRPSDLNKFSWGFVCTLKFEKHQPLKLLCAKSKLIQCVLIQMSLEKFVLVTVGFLFG